MMTPTITLRQKDTVSSLLKRLRYSLKETHSGDHRPDKEEKIPGADRKQVEGITHGVSNMTLHTLAIVLKQSVVFSMGRFLFCGKKKKQQLLNI